MLGKYLTEQNRKCSLPSTAQHLLLFSWKVFISFLLLLPISSQTSTLGMALVQTIFNSQEKEIQETVFLSAASGEPQDCFLFKYLSINLETS